LRLVLCAKSCVDVISPHIWASFSERRKDASKPGDAAAGRASSAKPATPSSSPKPRTSSSAAKPVSKSKKATPPAPALPTAAVLLDPATGRSLPCLLRREVTLSGASGAGSTSPRRALLTPLDATCALLRASAGDDDDYTEVDDGTAELDAVFAVAAEAALRHRGLVLKRTAFALTLRGVLQYSDADVISLDDGDEDGGECLGIEVCSFTDSKQGAEYVLYSPVDPLVLLARPMEHGEADAAVAASASASMSDIAGAMAVAAGGASSSAAVQVFVPAFDDAEAADAALRDELEALQAELDASGMRDY